MIDLPLKYGCNPDQSPASLQYAGEGEPLTMLNGKPSMINLLDGIRAWQLVRDLKQATGKAAAASFKHVSPAGAAVAGPTDRLSDAFCTGHFYPKPGELDYSPVAVAYAKARSSDRGASFGDFIAVSEPVDVALASIIRPEVSDGIIAPGYHDDALAILKAKQGGNYRVMQIDPNYEPQGPETRTVFGFTLTEPRPATPITADLFRKLVTDAHSPTPAEIETMLVVSVTLRHTQSNSVAVGCASQAVGIGAGQQSRIACVRLACDKADRFALKTHDRSLDLVSRFKAGIPRPVKVNLLDQYVRYHDLDEGEIAELAGAVDGEVKPIDRDDARQWIVAQQGVVLSSDAFFPFRDNLDRAARSGVKFVAQAGGSKRDDDVIAAANGHGMAMAMTGLRLFLH